MPTRALTLACLSVAVLSCARNPVTGKRQLTLVSEEQEIALGKDAAQQVAQTMPAYDDPAVQAYVSGLGMKLAKESERPDLPWTFTVLDDPTVNAFALPGGPIFITRGILTHLSSEAELAGVLGHEIGHVTARHSVDQISKAQLAQLGLGIGMVLSEDVARFGQLAGAGLQLLMLKHGRDAERQADELGFKYMLEHRYDPREMAGLFHVLERTSAVEGGGRLPAWASTHPDPGERAKTAERRAAKVENVAAMEVGREGYLRRLDGMAFGEDPRQGYFKGDTFLHPQLRFQLTLPKGWKAVNTAAALVAQSPEQDAAIQLTLAGKIAPEDAAKKFLAQQGVQGGTPERATVNGLTAVAAPFQAQTEQGALSGVVSWVSHGGNTFQIVGFTPAAKASAREAAFREVLRSFAPLTDPAALAVQPARLQLVKVPRDMTVDEFNRAYPSTAPVERVAIVNGVAPGGSLKAGTLAKRIVGGPPAEQAGPSASR